VRARWRIALCNKKVAIQIEESAFYQRIRLSNRLERFCGGYHRLRSIGRGDSPNSSDGVVPYWSSHLNGAESEHIVPSDHGAHQNPQAIAEVMRILKATGR
jgi:hypothetical protein